MAILKVARGDRVLEIPVPIYESDKSPKKEQTGTYSVNNGMITQSIKINLIIGDRCIYFPMTYKTVCNGVFIDKLPDDMRGKVYIKDIKLDHFIIHISPHTHNIDEVIRITSTGY